MDHERNVPVGIEAAGVLRSIARRWSLVLGTTLVIVGLLVFVPLALSGYSATARVVVRLLPSATEETTINMVTEAQVAGSPEVAERAASALGTDPDDILESTSIEPVLSSEILKITSTQGDADSAELMANALASAYLEERRERAFQTLRSKTDALANRLQQTRRQLATVGSGRTEQARARVLFRNMEALRDRIADLRGIAAGLTGGELIERAQAEPGVEKLSMLRNAFIGLVLGLGLGIALALFVEAVRGKLRASTEIEAITGAPVLLELEGVDPPAASDLRGIARLAVVLDAAAASGNLNSILVTYSDAGSKRLSLSRHLGQALTDLGRRVLLIDATDHSTPGFVDVLNDQDRTPEDLSDTSGGGGVSFMSAGGDPAAVARAFASDKLTTTLASLSDNFDLVLLEAGAFDSHQLPILLSSRTDGVVVVIAEGTSRSVVLNQVGEMRRVEANVVGVVVVGAVDAAG